MIAPQTRDKGVAWGLLGLTAVIAIAFGIFQVLARPNASYLTPGSSLTGGYVSTTTSCISAWDRFTGHYANPASISTVAQARAQIAANNACSKVIDGRGHLGILLLVIGVIAGVLAAVMGTRQKHATTQDP